MAMLLALGWLVEPGVSTFLVLAAVCGYVCLFTGAPHCLLRWIAPRFSAPLLPRFGTVVFILVFQVVLPLMRRLTAPMKLDVYGYKDLLNPIATLYAWETMDFSFKALVLALGAIGLFTYACLLLIAYHVNARRLADSS
jgi:hypothetical protein